MKKSEKKKKLLEMMNQADDEPVKTPPFNSNPLFNKMMDQPDFNNVPQKNVPFSIPREPEKKNDDDEFNVDELVKKIDAKIAELEEEERRNNKEKEEKKENEKIEVIGDEDKEVIQNIELKQPEISLDDDDDDDDDFFDDFFDN